jgi:hypothetical protein
VGNNKRFMRLKNLRMVCLHLDFKYAKCLALIAFKAVFIPMTTWSMYTRIENNT